SDAPPSAEDEAEFVAQSGADGSLVVARNKRQLVDANNRRRFSAKLASVRERFGSPLPPVVQDAWSDVLVDALEERRRRNTFDVVYATQSWMAEQARAAGFERIIVDVDDLVSGMSRQRARSSAWNRRKLIQLFDAAKDTRYERSLARRFTR